jgi:hypothetical protein
VIIISLVADVESSKASLWKMFVQHLHSLILFKSTAKHQAGMVLQNKNFVQRNAGQTLI